MIVLRTAPIQSRAARRIEAIANAAKIAIAASGTDHFTTSQVAEISGSSVGVVYRYFPDKLALLEYVYPEHIADAARFLELPDRSVVLTASGRVGQVVDADLFVDGQWEDAYLTLEQDGPLRVLHRPGVERAPIVHRQLRRA